MGGSQRKRAVNVIRRRKQDVSPWRDKRMRFLPLLFVGAPAYAARSNFLDDPAGMASAVRWLSIAVPLVTAVLVLAFALRKARRGRVGQNTAAGPAPDAVRLPWARRADWAAGRIESESLATAAVALGCFAFIWNSIVAVFILAWLMKPPAPKDARIVAVTLSLFVLVGIGVAAAAILFALRWRRYGKSYLELETIPGVIGGRIAGRVWAKLRPAPADKVLVSLECVRRTTSGAGRNREQREHVLWQVTHDLQGSDLTPAPHQGVYIPLEFFIPRECEATTSFQGEDGIFWRVQVRAKVGGPDYVATFQVPVFVTEASDSPESEELEIRERRKQLSQGPPAHLNVRITPTLTGGTELYWPPLRHVVGGIILLIIAGMLVAAMFLIRDPSAFVAYLVLGLFALLFAGGAATALGGASRVHLEPDGRLRVQKTVFGFGRAYECQAADIAAVERLASGRSGNRVYFTVQLRLKDGLKIPINWGMEEEDEASYVEALLEDWVQLYRQRESYHRKAE